jgi:hypothetical protein
MTDSTNGKSCAWVIISGNHSLNVVHCLGLVAVWQIEVKSQIQIKSEKEWWAPLARQHRNLTKSEGCEGEEEGPLFDSIWTSI